MTVKHSFLKISIDRDMYRLLIQNMDEYAHVEATSMGISIHGHMLNKSPMQVQTQTCTISRKCSPCTTCPDCLLPYLCFLHIFIIPHTIIAHVCFNKKDVLKKVCRRNLQDVLQLLQGQAVAGKRKRLRDQKGIPKNSFIRKIATPRINKYKLSHTQYKHPECPSPTHKSGKSSNSSSLIMMVLKEEKKIMSWSSKKSKVSSFQKFGISWELRAMKAKAKKKLYSEL